MIRAGFCSEHPGVELVILRRVTGYGRNDDAANVCPSPEHRNRDRFRCRWDGRELPAGGRRNLRRRAYCDAGCRIAAFRNRRREAIAAATDLRT